MFILRDDAAKSFMRTLESAKLEKYSDVERRKTDEKIRKVLEKRKERLQNTTTVDGWHRRIKEYEDVFLERQIEKDEMRKGY